MQYLAQIVNGINDSIKAVLNDKRFQAGEYNGIAILAADGDRIRALVTDHFDDDKFISVDDKLPVVIYHRTLQITRGIESKKAYGSDKPQSIKETASMCLIAYGTRKLIRMTPEELEAAIAAGIPKMLTTDTRKTLGLSSCQIELSNSILDQVTIYQQETKSEGFELPPNQLLIRVNYNIVSTYNTACFNLCDC